MNLRRTTQIRASVRRGTHSGLWSAKTSARTKDAADFDKSEELNVEATAVGTMITYAPTA